MPSIPNEKRILLVLVVAIFAAIQLPNVLVLGKNADGVEYAAVARNLAEGHGTHFRPYLSDHQWPVHYEQPPLFYGIQSLFFRIFTDTDYLEGIYGVTIALVVIALAGLFWRDVRRDRGRPGVGAWWPILLLLSVSQFLYNTQSNRLLTTFMVFALLSVWLSWRSVARPDRFGLNAMLAGIAIFLGFQTKGPFALFALAVPGIAWITFGVSFRRAALATVVSAAGFAALFGGLLLASADARAMWSDLIDRQVLDSVKGKREAHRPAFYNVGQFAQQMLGPLGVVTIAALATRTWIRRFRFSRTAAFFLLVALAGSLPLFFLPRQKVRYMLHAFPFFVMALGAVTEEAALRIQALLRDRRRVRIGLATLSALLVLAGATTMVIREGEVTKAHDFYRDIYLKDLPIPRRATIHVKPRKLIWTWHLWQYAQRHMAVNLKGVKPGLPVPATCEYLIVEKGAGVEVPAGFVRVNSEPVRVFLVYRRE